MGVDSSIKVSVEMGFGRLTSCVTHRCFSLSSVCRISGMITFIENVNSL